MDHIIPNDNDSTDVKLQKIENFSKAALPHLIASKTSMHVFRELVVDLQKEQDKIIVKIENEMYPNRDIDKRCYDAVNDIIKNIHIYLKAADSQEDKPSEFKPSEK